MRHEFTNYGQYTNDIEHLIIKKCPSPTSAVRNRTKAKRHDSVILKIVCLIAIKTFMLIYSKYCFSLLFVDTSQRTCMNDAFLLVRLKITLYGYNTNQSIKD